MTVTSYTSPSTTSSEDRDGKSSWNNPNNTQSSNDSYSTNDVVKNDYSDWLRATNFGFNIPTGATINGIEVQIEGHVGSGDEGNDSAIYLRKTNQVGDNYASASFWSINTDANRVYGGASDLWNTTWTVTEINNSNFGLDFSGYGDGGAATFSVDSIKIRIYYTAVGSGTNFQVNIGDTWKDVSTMKINIGDTWKDVAGAKVYIGDSWKTIF